MARGDNNKELKINVTADTSEFEKQIKSGIKTAQDLNKSLKNTSGSKYTPFTDDIKGAKKELVDLQRKFENIVSKSGAPKIARSIFNKRTAVAKPGSGIIGRVKDAVTIRMSDIKDFDIPELGTTSKKITRSFNKLTSPLLKIEGGKIEKFTADGFTEVFNAMSNRQKQAFSVLVSSYKNIFNTKRGGKQLPVMDLARKIASASDVVNESIIQGAVGNVKKSQLLYNKKSTKKYFGYDRNLGGGLIKYGSDEYKAFSKAVIEGSQEFLKRNENSARTSVPGIKSSPKIKALINEGLLPSRIVNESTQRELKDTEGDITSINNKISEKKKIIIDISQADSALNNINKKLYSYQESQKKIGNEMFYQKFGYTRDVASDTARSPFVQVPNGSLSIPFSLSPKETLSQEAIHNASQSYKEKKLIESFNAEQSMQMLSGLMAVSSNQETISNFSKNFKTSFAEKSAYTKDWMNDILSSTRPFHNVDLLEKKIKDLREMLAMGNELKLDTKSAEKQLSQIEGLTGSVKDKAAGRGIHAFDNLINQRYTLMAASWQMNMARDMIIGVVQQSVDAYRQRETARSGAYRAFQLGGYDKKSMTSFANKYISEGILSEAEAYQGLKLLSNKGLSEAKLKNFFSNVVDSAVANKENLDSTVGEVVTRVLGKVNANRAYPFADLGMAYDNTYWEGVYKQREGKNPKEKLTSEGKAAAQAMALEEMSKGFKGAASLNVNPAEAAFSKLNTSIQDLSATLGGTFIPLVISFANVVVKVLNPIAKWIFENQKFVSGITAAILSLVTITGVITGLGAAFASLMGAAKLLVPAITSIAAAFGIVEIAAGPIALAIAGLSILLGLTFAGSAEEAQGSWEDFVTSFKKGTSYLDPVKLEELKKQLKDLDKEMVTTKEDFIFSLTEMTKSHDDNLAELQKGLKRFSEDSDETFKDIAKSFKDNILDMDIDYTRKIEDLNRQIKQEMDKGLWGDMSKVADLERELKRTQEDYNRNKNRAIEDNAKQQKDAQKDYDRQMQDYTSQVLKEQQFYNSLNGVLSKLGLSINDLRKSVEYNFQDPDKAYRSYIKQTKDLEDRRTDLLQQIANNTLKTAGNTDHNSRAQQSFYNAIEKISQWSDPNVGEKVSRKSNDSTTFTAPVDNLFNSATNKLFNTYTPTSTNLFDNLTSILIPTLQSAVPSPSIITPQVPITQQATTQQSSKYNQFVDYTVRAGDYLVGIASMFGTTMSKILQYNTIPDPNRIYEGQKLKIPQFAKGGVVPGYLGQPVLAMVHGGETVYPAGQSPITINVNSPVVRRDEDIKKIADEVRKVMAEYQKYQKFK